MGEHFVPKDKEDFLKILANVRGELEEFLNLLTNAQMLAPVKDGRSVKDHLAHLAAWEQGIVALLQKKIALCRDGIFARRVGEHERRGKERADRRAKPSALPRRGARGIRAISSVDVGSAAPFERTRFAQGVLVLSAG